MVRSKTTKSAFKRKENVVGWLYCSPIIIGILTFSLIPIILSAYSTFLDWSGYREIFDAEFIGFSNWKEVLTGTYSADFRKALANTFFMLLNIPFSMLLGVLLALGMNRKMVGAQAFRVIYYLPCVTSVVAVSIIFQKLFTYDGAINALLANLNIPRKSWLTDDVLVKVTVNILVLWKGLGYSALMYLAGLQSVSKDQLEAASIDGANGFRTFISITLPALYPISFYLLVTSVMGGLQLFNEPFILVKYGTANNAMTASSFVYYYYQERQMGISAVGAWLLAGLVFIVTFIQLFVDNRKEKD